MSRRSSRAPTPRRRDDVQAASRQVLGVSYDELAAEVMRLWGWPDALQQASRKLDPRDPDAPASKDEYLRVVCTAANRLAAELDGADSAPALERCLADFQRDYAVPIGVGRGRSGAHGRARTRPMERSGAGAGLRQDAGEAAAPCRGGAAPRCGRLRSAPPRRPGAGREPGVTRPVRARRPVARVVTRSDPRIAPALSDALGAISLHAMSDAPIGDVLELVMTQLRSAMGLQRVVICLRDPATASWRRHASGDRRRASAPCSASRWPAGRPVRAPCSRDRADTLISDTAVFRHRRGAPADAVSAAVAAMPIPASDSRSRHLRRPARRHRARSMASRRCDQPHHLRRRASCRRCRSGATAQAPRDIYRLSRLLSPGRCLVGRADAGAPRRARRTIFDSATAVSRRHQDEQGQQDRRDTG